MCERGELMGAMYPQTRKIPTGRKQLTAEERLRRRVFCLCKELAIDDPGRKIIAGSCRRDKLETMAGMSAEELFTMLRTLLAQQEAQKRNSEKAKSEKRVERLRQHKRVDDEDSPYASERARQWLRGMAESLWGEQWPKHLADLIVRMMPNPPPPEAWQVSQSSGQGDPPSNSPRKTGGTRYVIPWDSERFPRRLHWEICEAVKAMLGRHARAR